jgi:hypothetical protein
MRASSRMASEREGMGLDQASWTGKRERVYRLALPAWCSSKRRETSLVQPQYRLPSPQRSM